MFDDLGAFQQSLLGLEPPEKQFEDFRNRRPCLFWTLAVGTWSGASSSQRRTVAAFVDSLSRFNISDATFDVKSISDLPEFKAFSDLVLDSNLIQHGAQLAMRRSELAIDELASRMATENVELHNEFNFLRKISSDLAQAYGNFATLNLKNANTVNAKTVNGNSFEGAKV